MKNKLRKVTKFVLCRVFAIKSVRAKLRIFSDFTVFSFNF